VTILVRSARESNNVAYLVRSLVISVPLAFVQSSIAECVFSFCHEQHIGGAT
jgi:hypothetical protein